MKSYSAYLFINNEVDFQEALNFLFSSLLEKNSRLISTQVSNIFNLIFKCTYFCTKIHTRYLNRKFFF